MIELLPQISNFREDPYNLTQTQILVYSICTYIILLMYLALFLAGALNIAKILCVKTKFRTLPYILFYVFFLQQVIGRSVNLIFIWNREGDHDFLIQTIPSLATVATAYTLLWLTFEVHLSIKLAVKIHQLEKSRQPGWNSL